MTEHQRLQRANALLVLIASGPRDMLGYDGVVSRFELDRRGRVWFHDYYSKRRIYTHYDGPWRGFTSGGTMKGLVVALREYIKRGDLLNGQLGPWPDWYCGGDLWAFGTYMVTLRAAARAMGILLPGDGYVV